MGRTSICLHFSLKDTNNGSAISICNPISFIFTATSKITRGKAVWIVHSHRLCKNQNIR